MSTDSKTNDRQAMTIFIFSVDFYVSASLCTLFFPVFIASVLRKKG